MVCKNNHHDRELGEETKMKVVLHKDTLRSKLPIIITVLCIVQPLLDIAGYWQQQFGITNTVTLILRMCMLAGTTLLGVTLSDKKRVYIIEAGVLIVITGLHILACAQNANGYRAPLTDVLNLVRIYYLPIMTINLITFLRQNDKAFYAMQKGLTAAILIIAATQLLSELTGTDPHTYSNHAVGILGWFLWTNSQSAILAMLLPIAICWGANRWPEKIIAVIILTAICEATLYVLAPRLAFGSMVVGGLCTAISLILADHSRWKQAIAIGLVTCLFVASYPLSPTNQRVAFYNRRMELTQKQVTDLQINTSSPKDELSESTSIIGDSDDGIPGRNVKLNEDTLDKMEQLYRAQDMMWSVIDRFGRDKVFEAYDYSTDPMVISQVRKTKITFCKLLMEEAGPLSKLFGLNLNEMTQQRYDKDGILVTDNYDVENDFHGVYFLTGIIGLLLMIGFLLYFGVRALYAVARNYKEYFSSTMAAFAVAYCLGLIHAYFTASILRRNNASIYFAMILAGLLYLSQKKKDEGKISTRTKPSTGNN